MKNHFTKVCKKKTYKFKKTDLSKDILQNITSESIKDVNLKTAQANCKSNNAVAENTEITEISDVMKSSSENSQDASSNKQKIFESLHDTVQSEGFKEVNKTGSSSKFNNQDKAQIWQNPNADKSEATQDINKTGSTENTTSWMSWMLDKVQMKKGEINENSEEFKDLKKQKVLERYSEVFSYMKTYLSACSTEEVENTPSWNEEFTNVVEPGDIPIIKEAIENIIRMEISKRKEIMDNENRNEKEKEEEEPVNKESKKVESKVSNRKDINSNANKQRTGKKKVNKKSIT